MKQSGVFSRVLGACTIVVLGLVAYLGLVATGPDFVQGEHVRLVYIHPALAWTSYLAFGVTAVASVLYLWKRTRSRFWDSLAGASAEIGVLLCALTLITGSLWGRPTWGVYWTWDARLTTTAILFVLFVGYLAMRRVAAEVETRSKRSAVAALIAAADIPIVHFSVEWWQTLHQGRSLLRPQPDIHGLMLTTMLLGILGFTLLYVWLVVKRFQLERLEEQYQSIGIAGALVARREEAAKKVEVEV